MSAKPPLARAAIDRATHRRGDEVWLRHAWDNPASAVIVVDGGQVLVAAEKLVWTSTSAAPAGDRIFLGVPADSTDRGYFAVAASLPDPAPEGTRLASLREVGADLSAADAGLLAQATSLERWHARHHYCPLCGAATTVVMGGHLRRCVADGSEHYPRTDPAVIMLVTDEAERALLGRQPAWPPGRMSTLAGYVDAGETLEQAVAREVVEEVGVLVDEVRYVASQPWPFPSSLMLAFTATARSTSINVDGAEISEARWFSRSDLIEQLAAGTLKLPMRSSVAYYLIDRWFGGNLAELAPAGVPR
jgi:NAD+ diphosphatase